MEQLGKNIPEAPSASVDSEFDDPLVDHERSKGLPKGMFIGKDGVVYGFDEEANRREIDELMKTINMEALREYAKSLRPIQAELERTDPDL